MGEVADYGLVVIVLSCIGIPLALYLLYVLRSAYRSVIMTGSNQAYFDSIKNLDPEEGIEYIVNYIQNPKWGCPPGDLVDFLIEMSERNDGFGTAARNKMVQLGLRPMP